MSVPVSYSDYYTKASVSHHVLGATPQTLSNKIKKGQLFEPYSQKRNVPGARKYYNIADAMKISIMLYGVIKMDLIYKLTGYHENIHPYHKKHIKIMIGQSLIEVKKSIVQKSTDPVDLQPYLKQDEEANATGDT